MRALNLLGSSVRDSLKNLRDCSGATYGMVARRWQPTGTATRAARMNVIRTHHELVRSRAASTPSSPRKDRFSR